MSFHGSDSALGSSSLYLDGIPFKIGERFKRPPKVTLPSTITQADVTGALTEEYSFSTEEAVLAWLSDVRVAEETRKQHDQEQAQREAEENNAAEKSSSGDEDPDETDVKQADWNPEIVADSNSSWSNPVLANFSSDLLKPTPIASNPVIPSTTTGGNDFDIRAFDKVDDPFDNLELQVIDDLEELKSVLQGSQSTVNNNGHSDVTDKLTDENVENNHNANNCEGTKVTMRKNAVRLKRGKIGSTSSISSTGSTLDSANSQYVNFQSLMDSSKPSIDKAVPSHLPSLKDTTLTAQRHSVALPPLRGVNSSPSLGNGEQRARPNSNPELQLIGNGQVFFNNNSDYENVEVAVEDSVNNSSSPPSYSRHSISSDYVNVPPRVDRSSKGAAGIDGALMNKNNLRSAKSTPSLLHEDPHSSSPSALSHSPPSRPSAGQPTSQVQLPKPAPRKPRVLPKPPSRDQITVEKSAPPQVQPRQVVSAPVMAEPVVPPPIMAPPVVSSPVMAPPVVPPPVVAPPVVSPPVGAPPVVSPSVVAPPVVSPPVVAPPVVSPPVVAPRVMSCPIVPVSSSIQQTPTSQCCDALSESVTTSQAPDKLNGVVEQGRRVGRSTFYENIEVPPPQTPPACPEAWNKYSPLPPPKGQNNKKPPAIPPRSANERAGEPVGRPSSYRASQSLPTDSEDPYSSLSIEAQAFVNSLTSMGFPRPRASRAVLKLGQDHKLVVEHLCLINSMVEKGYTAPLSEMALHLFTNDFNKAVKYLDLYIQFQELGFQKEKIREALVRNDIDRDKALDFLTA